MNEPSVQTTEQLCAAGAAAAYMEIAILLTAWRPNCPACFVIVGNFQGRRCVANPKFVFRKDCKIVGHTEYLWKYVSSDLLDYLGLLYGSRARLTSLDCYCCDTHRVHGKSVLLVHERINADKQRIALCAELTSVADVNACIKSWLCAVIRRPRLLV